MTLTRKGPGWGPAMSSGRRTGRKGGRQRRQMMTGGKEVRNDVRKGKGRKVLSAPSVRKY